jgi:hypothetical protein
MKFFAIFLKRKNSRKSAFFWKKKSAKLKVTNDVTSSVIEDAAGSGYKMGSLVVRSFILPLVNLPVAGLAGACVAVLGAGNLTLKTSKMMMPMVAT